MQYVLHYYREPLHHGVLSGYTHLAHSRGRVCGDDIRMYLEVQEDTIVDASFDGACCAVTTAAASVLLEEIIGKPLAHIENLDVAWVLEALEVELPRTRMECAELPILSVREALHHPVETETTG